MDYRGPDLDLKTTRLGATSTEARREASGTPPASATARPANVRSGPIWVDEVVIACANHAYDVALAYRAAEVSLPHLLLAMTRVDAAAVALDARGIRVGALRRESAVAIASEPPAVEAGVPPRGAPELEDVLRLASSRASHLGRAATVDDVVQALADIGGDLPGGDLIVRYVPRTARDIWGTQAAPSRPLAAALGFELGEPDRSPASAGGGAATAASAAPSIDPAVLQSVLERLSTVERGLGERFSALEAAIAKQSPQSAVDLSPLEKRLAAIESALSAGAESESARPLDGEIAERLSAIDDALAQGAERGKELRPFDAELSQRLFAIEDAIKKAGAPAGDGERPVDAAIAGRLAAIEQALDDERVDRADGITALSDEITGVRSAVRLAAQAAEQAHAGQHEQAKLLAAALERNRIDFFTGLDRYRSEITAGVGDRIADIERWLNGNADRMTAAQAAYSAELNGVHESLVRLGTTQHTLASALDGWHDDESGEIELINSRIGALHEGGARRHAAIEKLSADVDTLAHLLLEDRGRSRGSFRRWLYGTEDWIKASWRKVTAPRPDGVGRGRFSWDFWRRREEG